jgi:hypothetical protein
MTPIGQPCMCEPMPWLYSVLVQSALVFVGRTLGAGLEPGRQCRPRQLRQFFHAWGGAGATVGLCRLNQVDP